MKVDLKIPGGGKLHMEREPMSESRFYAICILIGIGIACWTIIAFFEFLT